MGRDILWNYTTSSRWSLMATIACLFKANHCIGFLHTVRIFASNAVASLQLISCG